MSTALDVALWTTAVVGWTSSLIDLRHTLAIQRLPTAADLDLEHRAPPTVTVIVPARDEADRIEGTVRRLLAQRDVDIEIVVVDDRSADDTAAIVERVARDSSRVRLVRITELPPGWIGKCHALQRGAESARGDWILFTDGDAWIGDDVIARAVAAAQRERADHVAIAPHQLGASLLGEAGIAQFAAGVVPYMSRANRDVKGGFVGMGAFNLVRAAAWRAIGGHTRLAMEVIDDMKLGLLLSRGGFRSRAYVGPDAVYVEWSRTLFGIVKVLEKNLFAAMNYDVRIAAAVVVLVPTIYGLALSGAIVGGAAGWAAASMLVGRAIPAIVNAERHGSSVVAAAISPLIAPIMALATANSAWKTLRAGGVRWRGTHYTIRDLRRGLVR